MKTKINPAKNDTPDTLPYVPDVSAAPALSDSSAAPALSAAPGRRLLLLYLILQLLILIAIPCSKMTHPYSVTGKIMYSTILLNFLAASLALLRKLQQKQRNFPASFFLYSALTVTVAADYFLTLTDTHFNLGVFLFCIVQTIYAAGLGFTKKTTLLRLVLFFLFCLLLAKAFGMSLTVSLLEGYSFAMLTANIVAAFSGYRKSTADLRTGDAADLRTEDAAGGLRTGKEIDPRSFPDRRKKQPAANKTRRNCRLLLAIGLLLFAGCDLSLGLRNALWDIPSLAGLCSFLDFMIWNFYLPSQCLITLSWIYTE